MSMARSLGWALWVGVLAACTTTTVTRSSGDVVVYDNQMDADEDADPATAIAGGSIVIHTAKGAHAAGSAPAEDNNVYLPLLGR